MQTSKVRNAALAVVAAMAGQSLGAPLIGLTTTNQLYKFDSSDPSQGIALGSFITGLDFNEQIIGIDRRPASDSMYGVSNLGRLFVISEAGAASLVGALAADPTDATNPFTALNGTAFGVDFNPAADRLRITTNTGQNLRVNPANGLTTTDDTLNPGNPSIVASAYTNNDTDPGTGTTLYDIDDSTNTLYIQNPPNNGTLVAVGAGLGFDVNGVTGMEILGVDTAFACFMNQVTGKSSLYSVNLAAGTASGIGAFGIGGSTAIAPPLLDITGGPIPEPTTASVLVLGGLIGAALRRR